MSGWLVLLIYFVGAWTTGTVVALIDDRKDSPASVILGFIWFIVIPLGLFYILITGPIMFFKWVLKGRE